MDWLGIELLNYCTLSAYLPDGHFQHVAQMVVGRGRDGFRARPLEPDLGHGRQALIAPLIHHPLMVESM